MLSRYFHHVDSLIIQRIDATEESREERFRKLKPTILNARNGTGVYLLDVTKEMIKAKTRRYPGPVHSETRNEVPQESSVEPADINARKAGNTKDDYRTLKEQSGRNRKGSKFCIVLTGGGLIKCGTDPVSSRRELRRDSLEK